MWWIGGQIEIDTDGTFEEGPVCIVDSHDWVLQRKTARLVRVLWQHCGVKESPIPSCLGMRVRGLVV